MISCESSSRAGRSNQDVPLGQERVSLQAGLDSVHGVLGCDDSFFVDDAVRFDDGMNVFSGHAPGPLRSTGFHLL